MRKSYEQNKEYCGIENLNNFKYISREKKLCISECYSTIVQLEYIASLSTPLIYIQRYYSIN